MITKKNVKIDVRAVSWTDGSVNKYQAVGIVTQKTTNGETEIFKRIYGDPQPTKLAAIVALKTEAFAWRESAILVLDEINAGMPREEKKQSDETE